MCNWKKWIWPGILATVLLTALALMMKSGSIEQDLQAKALGDLSTGHQWASVEMDGRDLTLSGTAPTEDAAAEALSLAEGAYDVRIAQSRVELLPIADPYVFSATKAENGITLAGNVPNEVVKATIVEAATAVSPQVVDNLTLSRGAPEGFAEIAGFGISQLKGMTSGMASTSGTDLSVTGEATDMQSFEAIRASLAGAIPGGGKLAIQEVLSPAISPYEFSAVKNESGITLTGHVPDEATRSTMVTAAEAATDGTVTDNLETGRGASDGFAALAGFAVNRLQDLSTGSAVLTDTNLAVRGTAISPDAFDAANTALAGDIPSGGKVTLADITRNTVSPFTFSASSDTGILVLDGYVGSTDDKSRAVAFATTQNPNARIIDRLVVADGAPDGVDWAAAGQLAIAQASRLEKGTAGMIDGQYTITGTANSNDDYDALIKETSASLPAGLALAKADIMRPLITPYVWSFSNMEDGVPTLNGYVPQMDVSTANADQIMQSVGSAKAVSDNLQIGAGAPANFAAATSVGIQSASRLLNGKAEISGTELMVTGESLSEEAADQIRTNVENGLPPEFAGKHAITVRQVSAEPIITPADCQVLLTRYMETNKVYFETDKAMIQLESLGLIDRLAYAARRCPTAEIEVGGHTDSDGSDEYNQTLSEARANAVRLALIEAGVFAGRLTAKGYGEDNPVADNSTDAGKARNRRIEFTVLNK